MGKYLKILCFDLLVFKLIYKNYIGVLEKVEFLFVLY